MSATPVLTGPARRRVEQPLRIAFLYERPPTEMPPYVAADWLALSRLGDTRWARPVSSAGWRRLLGPRGWLPSREVWRAVSWCDVTVQWFATSPAPGLAARVLGKPIALIVGGYETAADAANNYGWMLDPRTRMLVKASLAVATVVLVGSRFQRDELRRVAPSARLSLLPLGADASVFRPLGAREGRVVTVGRVSSDWVVKGLDAFVLAARELAPTPFDVIGPLQADAAEKRLRSLASPNVSFLGPVPPETLPAFLGKPQVYAQLSLRETFCLALVEAMLAGCTPVVTDAGALPEIVGDCGHVVPRGSISAAVTAIRRALAHPSGLAARARASELFPIAKREEGLSELLLTLVRTHASR